MHVHELCNYLRNWVQQQLVPMSPRLPHGKLGTSQPTTVLYCNWRWRWLLDGAECLAVALATCCSGHIVVSVATCTAAVLHRGVTPISSLSEQAYDQYLRLMFREQEPELLITLPQVGGRGLRGSTQPMARLLSSVAAFEMPDKQLE
jgi:hypothetical protein